MDIFDAQFHLTPGRIDITLASMDAVGINSVLIDEYWHDQKEYEQGILNPGYRLANGAWRSIYPSAELASILHPDRFSVFVRLDRTDLQLESYMRLLGSSPFVRGFRTLARRTREEAEVFANGGYDEMFAVAQDLGMPICLVIDGWVHHLPRYLEKYPDLTLVVDHCGVPRVDQVESSDLGGMSRLDYFDVVLKLAEHPNVALKWAHVQRLFDAPDFPYDPARPFLRRAIDAFGADRVLWASDASMMFGHTWSDLLHSLRDDPEFSQSEKEWLLGRTARRIFDWPAPGQPS